MGALYIKIGWSDYWFTQVIEMIWNILEEFGISKENVIEAALEMYVPHPGIETEAKAREVFIRELELALSDPNVMTLIYGGVLLEREGIAKNLPGIEDEWYRLDLASIVADEVLGLAIASYIGGTKGTFEYIRFDKAKPGVLSKLGPFMDDVMGALIGGVSANMYTRALKTTEGED